MMCTPGGIQRVFPKPRLTITPKADYRFRGRVPRDVVAAKLADEARSIAYINFKDSVSDDETHQTYLACWQQIWRQRAAHAATVTAAAAATADCAQRRRQPRTGESPGRKGC
jgi:hypothetical protein